MRKIAIPLSVFGAMLLANINTTMAHTFGMTTVADDHNDWVKDPDQAWEGKKDDKTYWYKLEGTQLKWSADGKTWENAPGDTWADNNGHVLMIKNKNLVWAGDNTKTWSEVPDMKWQGSDGKWYKFDSNWTLWMNK